MKKHKPIIVEEKPYKGPRLIATSELELMKSGDYHAQSSYVKAWWLQEEGEAVLVGNCRPEVVLAFIEQRSLRPINEVRLIRRRDNKLIQTYVAKYQLSREAQEVMVKEGTKENILCMLRAKYLLYPEVTMMLAERGEGLLEAYLSPAKLHAI